jgi:hypothetical protein
MKVLVKIEREVSLDIFEEMPLKGRVEGTLLKFADEMYARYEEIMVFLNERKLEESEMLSWAHISYLFMVCVKKQLLSEAVAYTLQTPGKHNIMDNLMNIYTYDKFREYIMGEPMIAAFSQAIRSMPSEDALTATLHGSNIILLRRKFLREQQS